MPYSSLSLLLFLFSPLHHEKPLSIFPPFGLEELINFWPLNDDRHLPLKEPSCHHTWPPNFTVGQMLMHPDQASNARGAIFLSLMILPLFGESNLIYFRPLIPAFGQEY